jgi:DNA-binding GntR family transcriptional regulator
VAEHLDIDGNGEVLKIERIVRTSTGQPIEWRTTFLRDDNL